MVWLRPLIFTLLVSLVGAQALAETVLLEFTTQNCGPCQRMRPVVQRLAAEGYAVREVDSSRFPQAADDYKVDQFPTFLVLVDNREYARFVGGMTHEQLVQMIHKATAIAAQQAQPPADRGGVTFIENAPSANPFAQAQDPQPGRVTTLGNGQQHPTPTVAASPIANPFGGQAAPAAAPQPAMQGIGGSAPLVNSTVRLSIADAAGQSTGTGTIIDSRAGKALVLTCGHLFRESKGQGAVQITMFRAGPNGAEPAGAAQGQVIDFDLDRDLALLVFETTGQQVAVTPVAPRNASLVVEAPVTSVGCGHGANPTPWESRITAVNRYQGHPNVEVARAPEEGRSGGGLFNAAGQLIGVCFAADPQGNEGLYASIESIYQKLDALNLTATLQTPADNAMPSPQQLAPQAPQQVAAAPAPAPFEVRGQSETTPPAVGSNSANPFSNSTTGTTPASNGPPGASAFAAASPAANMPAVVDPAQLSDSEQATLQEIGRRAGNSEVIVIIQSQEPGGRSDVIKLNAASPEFIRTLEATRRNESAIATQPGSSLMR